MATRYLPLPEPVTGPDACPACDGRGVTGKLVRFEFTPGTVLVIDVFCPVCDGCGRQQHGEQCRSRRMHAVADDDGFYLLTPGACWQCGGRGWFSAQAFNASEVMIMRMPCGGCDRTVEIPREV